MFKNVYTVFSKRKCQFSVSSLNSRRDLLFLSKLNTEMLKSYKNKLNTEMLKYKKPHYTTVGNSHCIRCLFCYCSQIPKKKHLRDPELWLMSYGPSWEGNLSLQLVVAEVQGLN